MSAKLITGVAWQNSGVTCLARVVGNNNAVMTPASVATCTWNLTNLSGPQGPATVVPTTPLVPQNVLFNTLRLDGGWSEDAIGWNLAIIVSHTLLTVGNASYRVEFWAQPADNTEPVTVQWEFPAKKTFGP